MFEQTHETPSQCAYCDKTFTHSSGIKDGKPMPGDVTLCVSCGWPSIYTKTGALKKPDETEWKEIESNEEICKVRQAIREVHVRKVNTQ